MGGIQQNEIVQQILGASEFFLSLSLVYNLPCLSYTACFDSSLMKFYPERTSPLKIFVAFSLFS